MNNESNFASNIDQNLPTVSLCNFTSNQVDMDEFINKEKLIKNEEKKNSEKRLYSSDNCQIEYLFPSFIEIFNYDNVESLIEDIFLEFLDDVLYGILLQTHRASRLGYLFYLDPDTNNEFDKQFEIYDDNDVLGVFSHLNENFKVTTSGRNNQGSCSNNNLIKYECVCPNCDRNVAAIRFAPHLEKCMGMGRNSSRIATRRIANYNGDELDQLIEATGYITNHRSNENNIYSSGNTNNSSNTAQPSKKNDDDLMSIINAVATATSLPLTHIESINASSSSSSYIDVDISSSSSSCSIPSNNKLKKRKNFNYV